MALILRKVSGDVFICREFAREQAAGCQSLCGSIVCVNAL